MATVKQFEDLVAWKKSRDLTREVYKAFGAVRDAGFRGQIQRASVSVMSNIAEGFESGTRPEFINYLYIAKGSAGEVRAQLYAASDIGYINIETFKYLNGLALDCSRLIASFIVALKRSPVDGMQHKKEMTRFEHEREEHEKWLAKQWEEVQQRTAQQAKAADLEKLSAP